jgi:hypothetical protein
MSEYQYYEFLAIDRPLTDKQIAELRALSTRAQITPVSFVNEYHWGNFKGDPSKLMRSYFDAHVYFANWCHCYLALRVPRETLTLNTLQKYTTDNAFVIDDTDKHWVIYWSLNEGEDYDRFTMDDGSGWMARLSLIREELLRGDLRSLYLGWLAGVTAGELDGEELEPPVPAGLGQLSAAQQALTAFIEIDPDLLAAAAMGSPVLQTSDEDNDPTIKARTDTWLSELPHNENIRLLRLLLAGESLQAERQLKARYAAWQRTLQPRQDYAPRRSVTDLLELSIKAEQTRLQAEEKARVREEAKRKKQREKYLTNLATDFNSVWKTATQRAERGTSTAYDEVCSTIIDLSEAYALKKIDNEFNTALTRFMWKHARRPALARRLVEAGLWKQ